MARKCLGVRMDLNVILLIILLLLLLVAVDTRLQRGAGRRSGVCCSCSLSGRFWAWASFWQASI